MSYLDTLHNEVMYLREGSKQLDYLASAFQTVGNHKMAKALRLIATEIERSVSLLTEAYSDEVHENMVKAEESTANLVKTALAMVTKDAL